MRTEFILEYPVDDLMPADYNPRKIKDKSFDLLKQSILTFGIVKPVIINGDNGVLTAGHQRTKAMHALGIHTAPAVRISGIKVQDEIKFNLFHNSIETNKSKAWVDLCGDDTQGYRIVSHDKLSYEKNANGSVVAEIGRLILKYGEWGSIICDTDGNVIDNSDYAVAAKQAQIDVIVYVIDKAKAECLKEYLSYAYGAYNYDSLNIKSYNQLYCQMHRLQGSGDKAKGKRAAENHSSTYENYVIPRITKDMRIIDFGAGECQYAKMLAGKGFRILPYEPHLKGKNDNIDIGGVIEQIRKIEQDIRFNGLYDVVVLDSVINSVVSVEFEHLVMLTCNALTSADGQLILGTRSLGSVEMMARLHKHAGKSRSLQFLDENNFTATFRSGCWTMQHFVSKDGLKALCEKYYEDVEVFGEETRSNIYAICKIPKEFSKTEFEMALNIEFNMEYPNEYRHNRHERLVQCVLNRLYERKNGATL